MSPKAKIAALKKLAEAARQMVGTATEELSSSLEAIEEIGATDSTMSACDMTGGALLPLETLASDLLAIVTAAKVLNKQVVRS